MNNCNSLIALLCVLLITVASLSGKERKSYVIFQLDNDIFTGSDNDYTNGARIALMQPVPADSLNKLHELLKYMTGVTGNSAFSRLGSLVEDDSTQYDFGLGLSQFMYTPPDPEALHSAPGERPYAGWLGAEVSLHAKNRNALSSVIISLGITGKYAYAHPVQDWVHENISNSPLFQGWDSQIPAEITLNLFFDRKRRYTQLANATRDWPLQVDGYFEWGAMLGNGVTGAHMGSKLRIGYNLPVQYLAPRLQFGNYPHELITTQSGRSGKFSLYAFGTVRANAILHNITLDGPLFTEFDTGTSSEPIYGELVVGVGIRYHPVTIAYSRTFRGQEFRGQDYNHQFGSILISLAY